MTSQTIIPATAFTASTDIKYAKAKINPSGGKNIGVLNAHSMKSLYLSTPLMMTWGCNENDYDGKLSYDLSLQFPTGDWETPETTAFLNNMIAFENKIKADLIANSKDWMGKSKMSMEVLDALFTPIVRYPKNKDTDEPDLTRAPTLRIKIPFWEGDFKTELYDIAGSPIFPNQDGKTPVDLIGKAVNIMTVMQCGGIWFAGGKTGVTWKLTQAVVKPKPTLSGKCHLVVSPADAAKMESSAAGSDDMEDGDDDSVLEIEDDDSEAEVETVVATTTVVAEPEVVKEVVAAVAAKPAKKVVRRKKADTPATTGA